MREKPTTANSTSKLHYHSVKKASGNSNSSSHRLAFKGHITSLRGSVVPRMKNEADKEELVFLLLPAPIAEDGGRHEAVTQTVDEGCDGFCRMLSKILL